MGRLAKSPSTRARTNAVPGGEFFYDPTPIKPRRMPPSPPGGWCKGAHAHWHAVMSGGWTALMDAAQNAQADTWLMVVHRLHRALADPNASAASISSLAQEERKMRASFGGDPVARVRLRWWPKEADPRVRLATVSSFPTEGIKASDLDRLESHAP